MTHADFHAARKRLGHTQRSMAVALGRNYRTIQRMETGELPITAATASHVALLLKEKQA